MPNVMRNSAGSGKITRFEFPKDIPLLMKKNSGEEKSSDSPYCSSDSQDQIAMDIALKQTQKILDVAHQEAEKIKEEAERYGYEDGFKKGREDGYEEAFRENQQKFAEEREIALNEVKEAIEEIHRQKEELLNHYIEELRDIAVAVGEKVIHVSLESSAETIKLMIVAGTRGLKKQEWAKIYLSRYDADMLVQGDAEFLNTLSYLSENVKIITMENEERGTCIVELPDEIIDMSVRTQMDNIIDIIQNT